MSRKGLWIPAYAGTTTGGAAAVGTAPLGLQSLPPPTTAAAPAAPEEGAGDVGVAQRTRSRKRKAEAAEGCPSAPNAAGVRRKGGAAACLPAAGITADVAGGVGNVNTAGTATAAAPGTTPAAATRSDDDDHGGGGFITIISEAKEGKNVSAAAGDESVQHLPDPSTPIRYALEVRQRDWLQ